MAFSFLFEDTNDVTYRAVIDDEGDAFLWTPEGDEFDQEAALALEALGLAAELSIDFQVLWESIITQLEKDDLLDDFIEEVRMHGTTQERWVRAGRFDLEGYYEEYIYEFTLEEFVGYLGKVIIGMFEDYNDAVLDVAKLAAAIRNSDGTSLEFDIDDSDWEEATNNEMGKMWAGVDRTIYANGEEMFSFTADWTREIYDPVTFESDVDEYEPHRIYPADSDEMEEIIKIFGLLEKREKLNEKTLKTMPEPEHPVPYEEGTWGVYYHYNKHMQDPKTGDWLEEEHETVVPYWSKEEAQQALELARVIFENNPSISDDFFDFYIVRRISKEKAKDGSVQDRPFDPALDFWDKW